MATSHQKSIDIVWMSRRISDLFGRISATIEEWASELEQSAQSAKISTTSPISNTSPASANPEQQPQQPSLPQQPQQQPQHQQQPQQVKPTTENAAQPVSNSEAFQRFVRPATAEVPWKKRHEGEKRKRVRVNWTPEENRALFDAVIRGSVLSEDDLVTEIVSALGGSRTRFQAKGRFRNLLVSGRIRKSEDSPARWIVVDGTLDKRRKRAKKEGDVNDVNEVNEVNEEHEMVSADDGSDADKGDDMDHKNEQA